VRVDLSTGTQDRGRIVEIDEFLTKLNNWIQENGEALIYIDLPHSGGSGNFYLLKSSDQLDGLINFALSDARKYGDGRAIITGFRSGYYPLRGIVDEALIEKIKSAWDGKNWYSIISLEDVFPEPLRHIGSGNTQEEFDDDVDDLLADWLNYHIGFGENPYDTDDWAARNYVETIEVEIGNSKFK
jgi:hypothetical protein